jgi:anti-anti-sigma factor
MGNANELQERIVLARIDSAGDPKMIRLDFADCDFIDSTGLRLVLHAARALRDDGGELSVTNLKGEVARTFENTGMLVGGSPIVRAGT